MRHDNRVKFAEVKYRDCGYCGTRHVALELQWSSRAIHDSGGERRFWAALACPRCAGVTLLEMSMQNEASTRDTTIGGGSDVTVIRAVPRSEDTSLAVDHLPSDVSEFYENALRVLQANVPDAAAVQLRKTLEAAAAHKGIRERQLVSSIKKLVEQGYVTLDFKDVMTHIRQIGNAGAHYTDVRLTKSEVERSLRFTTQVLRNLFEVPGELEALRRDAEAEAETAPTVHAPEESTPTGTLRI